MRSGLLLVDKPAGLTSHDVVARVRRAARTKQVGHAGTLDPFATGLLVLAVGHATRLLRYLDSEPKVYLADIAFGTETDTDDATGAVVRTAEIPPPPAIVDAVPSLIGPIEQIPPSYSAKHVDGRRAYELARKGTTVVLEPVQVTVFKWSLLTFHAGVVQARIVCSGGTYIRALARDLGRNSGSAAHCATLRRESSGSALLDHALSMDAIEPGSIADGTVPLVNPLGFLQPMEQLTLDAEAQRMLRHGRVLSGASFEHDHVVFLDEAQAILGIGARMAGDTGAPSWQPRVVLDLSSDADG